MTLIYTYLKDEQAKLLYSYLKSSIDPKDIAFQIAFETGARIGEVVSISKESLTNNTLTIKPLKNSNTRQVYVSDNLAAKIRHIGTITIGKSLAESAKLESQKKSLYRHIVKTCESLLGIHVNPHMLRHTAFTRLYLATRDILGVKQWAGHKSINSTLVYMQADQVQMMSETMQSLLK